VDLGGVVPVTLEVTPNHLFQPLSSNIRPAKTARVEQHFLNVPSEHIPVPDPEMEDLVSPRKRRSRRKPEKTWSILATHCGIPTSYAYSALNRNSRKPREAAPESVPVLLPNHGRSKFAGVPYFRRQSTGGKPRCWRGQTRALEIRFELDRCRGMETAVRAASVPGRVSRNDSTGSA